MAVLQGNAKQGSTRGFYPRVIEGSLRFNDDDSAYLSWTPESGSGASAFTFSAWCKISNIDSRRVLFAAGDSGTNPGGFDLRFESSGHPNGAVLVVVDSGGVNSARKTLAFFRDTSAWYHVVFAIDTAEGTGNRTKIWVNGVQQSLTGTELSSSYTTRVSNSSYEHYVGANKDGTVGSHYNGYLAEVHFTDGTAYDADAFGELKNGVWVAKTPDVTYGTNGFYLDFQDDTEVEAFNTVLYRGNGVSGHSITGFGFQPDLLVCKERDDLGSVQWTDAVRGVGKRLDSDYAGAEVTSGSQVLSFDSDGFSVNGGGGINESGKSYVAWGWKAGDSNVSNTDGSITSTVRANDTYGFSIISFSGNSTSGATIGHGLGAVPSMVILKSTNAANNWQVYHASLGNTKYLFLNDTIAAGTNANRWNNTDPTSSVITLGNAQGVNYTGEDYIAYCWAEKTGYSKFGSYTSNTSTYPTITTGFRPAFVLLKNITSGGTNWTIFDGTRNTTNTRDKRLAPNTSAAEGTEAQVNFTDTGFELTYVGDNNYNTDTIIYAAFADTREAAFWLDQSGNNNDWQPVNLDHNDTVADSPTNNFCTLNSALSDSHFNTSELSNGNLVYNEGEGNNGNGRPTGTFSVTSGKWYWEVQVPSQQNNRAIGFTRTDNIGKGNVTLHGAGFTAANSVVGIDLSDDTIDQVNKSGTHTQHASGLTGMANNDIFGISVDLDGGTFQMYRNGSTYGGSYSLDDLSDWQTYGMTPTASGDTYMAYRFNFGQQGFTYTPPSGYLALSTANLPDPAIDPAQGSSPADYFNTVLYTGSGSTGKLVPSGFATDFIWLKDRGDADVHQLVDIVRGGNKLLQSNQTDSEYTLSAVDFLDDGVELLTGSGNINGSGDSFVSWHWKANGSGVSNTDGSITSTVSANTESGFSIVEYSGTNNASESVGHGLTQKPQAILLKKTTSATDWVVYHESVCTDDRHFLYLNTTASLTTGGATRWDISAFDGDTFTVGDDHSVNASGEDYIAYCFHSVEGFSKFGSYVANASSDGTFIYTGFSTAFLMVKRADNAGAPWSIIDNTRNTYNKVNLELDANTSVAEFSINNGADFVSNGVKLRDSAYLNSSSGNTFIYMAFAENPFKYSNAR